MKREDLFDNVLSGAKTKRVLVKLGVDPEKFDKAYREDNERAPRTIPPPTEEEFIAVDNFLATGNFVAFQNELDRSPHSCNSTLRRVIQYRKEHE